MQLFGTSGIRRLADKGLIEMALKVGLAVGREYGEVVVGCDTRTSGEAVKHAFLSGLLAGGSRAFDAGILPTPTLALAASEFQAGAMITASHNPPEYNGIKLLNPDGSAFDSDQRQQIEDMVLGNSLAAASWSEIENSSVYPEAVERHIERIRQDFPGQVKLKVVIDCGCGAASVITPELLRRMGVAVVELNCRPSGLFPHPVEPIQDNLSDLIRTVRETGADLGIAHDGDGDRLMAVDDKGRFVPGDKLLAIFARQGGARKVVTTIDASMTIDDMGFRVSRTPVGDNYVSEELKNGGDFGGEPSGAWVFPANSLCPDGIYAAARLVTIASQQKISSLVDSIPGYPLLRGNVAGKGIVVAELARKLQALSPVSVSYVDGIRLNFEDGWLLVRASGTEPKIRVTAEARSEPRARQLYDSGVTAIAECMKINVRKS